MGIRNTPSRRAAAVSAAAVAALVVAASPPVAHGQDGPRMVCVRHEPAVEGHELAWWFAEQPEAGGARCTPAEASQIDESLAAVLDALSREQEPQSPATDPPLPGRPEPGAVLPSSHADSDLPGRVRYVAPNGSDRGDGSLDRPLRSLASAVAASAAGDSIVLRGGDYSIDGPVAITKPGLTITARSGETPLFDGSKPAPASAAAEGRLRWFDYRPMPAREGGGLVSGHLPAAAFGGDGSATGLARERGWRCVPNPPGDRSGSTRCPAGQSPRVTTGLYPDQVWIDGEPLVQVLEKPLVRPGSFYIDRDEGRAYLAAADAADMSLVRVSASSGEFLLVAADGVRVEGLRITNHSPDWTAHALSIAPGVAGTAIRDVAFGSIASVAVGISGSGDPDRSGLVRDTTIDRVTIDGSGWMGISTMYTDDLTVTDSRITGSDPAGEFAGAPKRGGIKASRNHRMHVVGTSITNNGGHGLWWDQSNYDTVLANSRITGNADSGVFYEISHGLTMVNNLVTARPGSSAAAVRLAGSSGLKLVNNTVIGMPAVAITADPRGGTYGPEHRPCVEHVERYSGAGFSDDCPQSMPSDLDKARPGAFGKTNLTPALTWRPELKVFVNNVLASPAPIQGPGTVGAAPTTQFKRIGTSPYPADTVEGPRFVIRTPGAVYDSWEFDRLVEVRAPGVTFRNSVFRGVTEVVPDAALLYVRNDRGSGGIPSATVEDSTFLPRGPNNQIDGVRGSNFSLSRVEISRTVDGVHIHGSVDPDDPHAGNVKVTGSWIHDLTYYKESSHPDGTHNDGVQIVGGRNITIEGNRIDGSISNAAIMVGQPRSPVADLRITRNQLGGGACTINLFDGGRAVQGLSITGNRFRPGTQSVKGCATTITPATAARAVLEDNEWLAGSGPGTGGVCGGPTWLLCIRTYTGSASSPTLEVPLSEVLPADLVMDGNLYQGPAGAARIMATGTDGVAAEAVSELRSALGSRGLRVEEHGQSGSGWVDATGDPTAALAAMPGAAVSVPSDPVISTFLVAGDRSPGFSMGLMG